MKVYFAENIIGFSNGDACVCLCVRDGCFGRFGTNCKPHIEEYESY